LRKGGTYTSPLEGEKSQHKVERAFVSQVSGKGVKGGGVPDPGGKRELKSCAENYDGELRHRGGGANNKRPC